MEYRITAIEENKPIEFYITAPTEEEAWDKAMEETEGEIVEITCIGYRE